MNGDMADGYSGVHYRTGRHNPRNIYRIVNDGGSHLTDVHMACTFAEEDGAWVAAALDVYTIAIQRNSPVEYTTGHELTDDNDTKNIPGTFPAT